MVKFDDQMRQFVLDLHNQLRNKVAVGKEGRNKQPPAADMKILVSRHYFVFGAFGGKIESCTISNRLYRASV